MSRIPLDFTFVAVKKLESLFPSFEKELIREIFEKGEWKTFNADEKLVRTGQFFRSILLILDGLIKVYREDEEGREYFMYYLQASQGCALSMKCPEKIGKSEIMARVAKNTTVIAIPYEQMEHWMSKYKSWRRFVMDTFQKRIEELLTTIDDIAFKKMDERLLSYLQKARTIYHSSVLTINNTELAEELNSSREVISRLMKKLADDGVIRLLKNQQIELLDVETENHVY